MGGDLDRSSLCAAGLEKRGLGLEGYTARDALIVMRLDLNQSLQEIEGEIADKFDVVVALDAFGWITKEPHTLLARMGEMASQKVIARFPGGAAFGDRLRRLWAGGPGLSYSGRDVRTLAHHARLPNFRIEKLREDGYILIATMRGRRSGAA